MFEGMDADESGALSTDELSEGLATLGYQVRSLARPPSCCRWPTQLSSRQCAWRCGDVTIMKWKQSMLCISCLSCQVVMRLNIAMVVIMAAGSRTAELNLFLYHLEQVSPRELGKLVERVDLNGDGAINFDEFAASLVDWQQVSMHPELCCRHEQEQPASAVHRAQCSLRAQSAGRLQCGCPPVACGSWYRVLVGERQNSGPCPVPQLQDDNLWAKWIDVAFSKLDLNSDGFISVDEIVRAMPGDSQDDSDRLLAISKVCHRPQFPSAPRPVPAPSDSSTHAPVALHA